MKINYIVFPRRIKMPMTKEEKKIYNAWYRQTPQGKMAHKIGDWKRLGLICDTKDDYELVYFTWLHSETCEDCNKPYTTKNFKCMDHNHDNGVFRNILCNPCNTNKRMDNTSGIPNISWDKKNNYWEYRRNINGKSHRKISKDLEWLKQYKIDYEQEHYY